MTMRSGFSQQDQETARHNKGSYKPAKAADEDELRTNAEPVARLGPLGLYILVGFFAVLALAILIAVIAFSV
ncbi:MAG: hypothetical protein ACLP7F_09225 [Acidimicrobiales bacterium]